VLKMSKLKKMKMPEKKGEEMEGMEDSPELAAQEEEMGMDLDGDMEAGESAEHQAKVLGQDLEALSDEELMAELKKRGLMSKLGEEEEMGEEESMEMPMA